MRLQRSWARESEPSNCMCKGPETGDTGALMFPYYRNAVTFSVRSLNLRNRNQRVIFTLECIGCMIPNQRKGSLSFSHLCNLCVHLLSVRPCLATGGSAGTEPMWFLLGCCLEGEWKHLGLWAVVEGQNPEEEVTHPLWRDQRRQP